ncbi:MAG: tRNA (N(6)-L-threonylcarbamoyladenosine(37)-C(2))-methylthiotransferase MtaB, partial [Eubacterium sp.]|nr:tRNA (N(6)-L-threonylcarbamoyladenosine(37)-C(2))-methylthiotransferase MtaB [Eubacterium sp.]
MKRAALHNLGCKVNAYETQAMQQLLEQAGYKIVAFGEQADVYVVNTCSVTNIADRKSRQMLHRARRLNPDAVLVAAGCYVQAAGPDLLEEGIADIILGNNKKEHLIRMLDEYQKTQTPATDWEDINRGQKQYERLFIRQTAGHTRAFIKIQDGCNQFCSYCVIPYARGRVRSRGQEEILEEVRGMAA